MELDFTTEQKKFRDELRIYFNEDDNPIKFGRILIQNRTRSFNVSFTKVNLKFLHKDLVCFLPPKDLGLGLMNIVEDLAVKSVTYMKSTEKLEEKRYAYHF